MTERKPPGLNFESWVDRQIREAAERGEFDDLPGTGQPLPNVGRRRDEMWWIKQKLDEEDLSFLPPTLALRKEVELAVAEAEQADSEDEARRLIREINKKIAKALADPMAGPPVNLAPINIERVLASRRAEHRTDGSISTD